MAHGVFHNGLENQGGQVQHRQYVGQVPGDMDGVLEAGLGESQVVADIGQLLDQETCQVVQQVRFGRAKALCKSAKLVSS